MQSKAVREKFIRDFATPRAIAARRRKHERDMKKLRKMILEQRKMLAELRKISKKTKGA